MNKILIKLLIIFSCFNALSQNQNNFDIYITIDHYRELYDPNFSITDSTTIDYHFPNNDTIISLNKYIPIPKDLELPFAKDPNFLNYYRRITNQQNKDRIKSTVTKKYWNDPIKIFFSDEIPNRVQRKLIRFTDEIADEIDELEISRVQHIEDANYIIYTFNDFEYESALAKNKKTSYYQFWENNCEIYKTAVKIDQSIFFNDQLLLGKLKSFFIQNLGYFSLSDSFQCESYFSNCYSPQKQLLKIDLEMIKYHYSSTNPDGDFDIFFEEVKEQLCKNGNEVIRFVRRIEKN